MIITRLLQRRAWTIVYLAALAWTAWGLDHVLRP